MWCRGGGAKQYRTQAAQGVATHLIGSTLHLRKLPLDGAAHLAHLRVHIGRQRVDGGAQRRQLAKPTPTAQYPSHDACAVRGAAWDAGRVSTAMDVGRVSTAMASDAE